MIAANPVEEFKIYSHRIANYIFEEGISFRPYAHPSLPYFQALNELEKKQVVEDLKRYIRICDAVKKDGASLKNNRLMTEKALSEFGFTAHSEDLDHIEPHHIVEIYNLSHLQIFRSFRYFEMLSYTLEDIYCRKWYYLYDRTEEDQLAMAQAVFDFYALPDKKATKLALPPHLIKEKDSLEKLTLHNQTQWLIPVFQNGNFVGIMGLQYTVLVP